jgi:hypothetical protein
MAFDEKALANLVWRTRIYLLESLVLKLHLLLPVMTGSASSIQTSLRLSEQALEKDALTLETFHLSDPILSSLSDEQRAHLADEMREMIESVKVHLRSVANSLKKSQDASQKKT